MHRKRTVVPFAAAVSAAALIVTACSSSGSGSTGSSSATTPAAPAGTSTAPAATSTAAAAGSPVKIGIICSCSGPFGATTAIGGKVAQAWVKSVNAAGGIAGHPVDAEFKDDASNPGTAVTAAQALVSDHVAAILDLSLLEDAWAKVADDAKIPVIGGDITAPIFTTDPNFYPSGGTNDGMVNGDILVAKQAGAKNLGQMYCAEAPQCAESVKAHQTAGKKYGVPVVYNVSIAATAPNYTAQCLAAKQAGVTSLFIGDIAAVFAHVASDCAQQGYRPNYIEVGTGLNLTLARTPALQDSLWISFPILPYYANVPAVQKMNSAVDKYYPGLRQDENWGETGVLAWTGGLLIQKAVEDAKVGASADVTADAVRTALDSMHNETLDGWSPPLNFSPNKVHSVNCFFAGRMHNGKLLVLNNNKYTCPKS